MYGEIINFKDHIKHIYVLGSTNSYRWALRDQYYTVTLNKSIRQNMTIYTVSHTHFYRFMINIIRTQEQYFV